MSKTDSKLGSLIAEMLEHFNIETPMVPEQTGPDYNTLRFNVDQIMKEFDLDMSDDSLKDTPHRVTNMYCDELFRGLNYHNFPKCTTVDNKFGYDEMVTVSDIPVLSLCEHHLLPIDGFAKISYIPKDNVLGLSKFARVTDFFARRPQVQERLTEQIYHALVYILGTQDVAVQIKASHFCMRFRGVKVENSLTTTTKLGGSFKKAEVRAEFLNNK